MKTKPNHISQEEWDSVTIHDHGNAPVSNMFRSNATTALAIADDVARQYRGKQKKPTKQATTVRLSTEVLSFFKAEGKGWQTRMSSVLEEYVKKRLQG